MIKRPIVAIVLAACLAGSITADADAQAPSSSRAPSFQPGLGDLMTAFIQPRHIKLGLGGQARNWDYAAYEWSELNETFELVEKQVPKYGDMAMADLLQIVKKPMTSLEAAIKARDGSKFDTAYEALTGACNACHQTLDRKPIVIQVPKAAMFPDQSFAPQKP
jgi:hypothetical protein